MAITARAALAAVVVCAALILLVLGLARAAPASGLTFTQYAPTAGRSTVVLDPFTRVSLQRADRSVGRIEYPAEAMPRSPDGTRMVRPQVTSSGVDLFVEEPDGGLTRLTRPNDAAPGRRSNTFPLWSPDGEWVSFVSTDPQLHMDLYIVRADGTDLRRIYPDVRTPIPLSLRWVRLDEQPFQPWLALAGLGTLAVGAWASRRLVTRRRAN
jgi:hypothetical protein